MITTFGNGDTAHEKYRARMRISSSKFNALNFLNSTYSDRNLDNQEHRSITIELNLNAVTLCHGESLPRVCISRLWCPKPINLSPLVASGHCLRVSLSPSVYSYRFLRLSRNLLALLWTQGRDNLNL